VRALKVLRGVDLIAAEDTRRTGRLLQLLGIETAGASVRRGGPNVGPSLVSHHEHNTVRRVPELIKRAQAGAAIAVVSDAGTPGIADPGGLPGGRRPYAGRLRRWVHRRLLSQACSSRARAPKQACLASPCRAPAPPWRHSPWLAFRAPSFSFWGFCPAAAARWPGSLTKWPPKHAP